MVIDEVAGYFVTVSLFVPSKPLVTALSAFVLFRFFDILKPYPIRKLEALRGGLGVALDDIAAGVAASGCLHLFWILCYRDWLP